MIQSLLVILLLQLLNLLTLSLMAHSSPVYNFSIPSPTTLPHAHITTKEVIALLGLSRHLFSTNYSCLCLPVSYFATPPLVSSPLGFAAHLLRLHFFLFRTFPIIWMLTASRTCLSRLVLHLLTTLKLNWGFWIPSWEFAWCSSIWLYSFLFSVSSQGSLALLLTDLAISPTYRLGSTLLASISSLSATILHPGGLHFLHSLLYILFLAVHGSFFSSPWAQFLKVGLKEWKLFFL